MDYNSQQEETFSEMIGDESSYQEYDTYSLDDIQSNASSENEDEFSVVKKKSGLKKKKTDDIGYRKIKIQGLDVEYFATSCIPSATIRDPINGKVYYDHRVGSGDEDLYYKVAYMANGSKNQVDHLYYDNPEQFESHLNCSISTENKQIWADKYQVALRKLEKTT